MRSTQQFNITLPNEMTDIVKNKVTAGEDATESEVFGVAYVHYWHAIVP